MIALNRVRWVQVLIGENHWKDAIFSQLESGDIFRLVEPNGQLAHGGQVYVVREAPQVAVQEWPASGAETRHSFGVGLEDGARSAALAARG